jgi:group I intron endonuclease
VSISGIYWIYQPSRDRAVYVGSSVNIGKRWIKHRYLLRKGSAHHNQYFQNVWNKYGEQDFQFLVLEECPVDKLVEREQFWHDALSPLCNQGECVESPRRGRTTSAETRAKIGAANKGRRPRPMSTETITKMSLARSGKSLSPEHRAAISAGKKGVKFTDEHRAALSAARRRHL